MADRVYKNDSAILEANLFDEDGVSPLPATSVSWQVKKPDGTLASGGPTPVGVAEADINFTDTSDPGLYLAQITFTLTDGAKRSTMFSFEVIDPLESSSEGTTNLEKALDMSWMLFEDLFDSELGGPFLRDRTMAQFNRNKMDRLAPRAFYRIGNTFQPASSYDETNFPFAGHTPLFTQAMLVETINHLMRSYVEQPSQPNANIPYFDRRDYLNRWKLILDGEEKLLIDWLDLFKRDQLGFQSSLLVGGYSTNSIRYPRYMRGRVPYVYRW